MLITAEIRRPNSQCSFVGNIVKGLAGQIDRRIFRWIAVAIVVGFWALVYRMAAA